MPTAIERALVTALEGGACHIGQIRMELRGQEYFLFHREDAGRSDLCLHRSAEDALALARFDDEKNYRPLKTAPDLAHGWQLQLTTLRDLRQALNYFYPGRLAALVAARNDRLATTSLRETLGRQSGMYRVAARISDAQIDEVVGNFCRSKGGCVRTILWKRDESGREPSIRLPSDKYDRQYDQSRAALRDAQPTTAVLPLLCQEACNLLVSACRKAVQSGKLVSDVSKSG
jgi:sirohydrochlorin cobaltochelatase